MIGIVVAAFALLITISLIAARTGASAAAIGFIVALLPLAAVLLGVRWIDRWEPEPRRALLFAFLWGAGISTFVALWVNNAAQLLVYQQSGSQGQAELIGTSLVAPVVEESAKGLGVLLIFLLRRRNLDGPVDGIVYAAMTAGGFAFVENILYFGKAIDTLPQVFMLRGILSPFAHVLFTAAIGIALGIAARHRNRATWLLTLPIGWLVAVVLHAVWNTAAMTSAFFGFYVVVQIPLFVIAVLLVAWLRRRERGVIHRRLTEYAGVGWFAPAEVAMLCSLAARRSARGWAAARGRQAGAAMKTFQHTATDLAFTRQRQLSGRRDVTPGEEMLLLQRLTQARGQFLAA